MAKLGGDQRGATSPKIQKIPGKPLTEGATPPKITVVPKPSGGTGSTGSSGSGNSGGSKG